MENNVGSDARLKGVNRWLTFLMTFCKAQNLNIIGKFKYACGSSKYESDNINVAEINKK